MEWGVLLTMKARGMGDGWDRLTQYYRVVRVDGWTDIPVGPSGEYCFLDAGDAAHREWMVRRLPAFLPSGVTVDDLTDVCLKPRG